MEVQTTTKEFLCFPFECRQRRYKMFEFQSLLSPLVSNPAGWIGLSKYTRPFENIMIRSCTYMIFGRFYAPTSADPPNAEKF